MVGDNDLSGAAQPIVAGEAVVEPTDEPDVSQELAPQKLNDAARPPLVCQQGWIQKAAGKRQQDNLEGNAEQTKDDIAAGDGQPAPFVPKVCADPVHVWRVHVQRAGGWLVSVAHWVWPPSSRAHTPALPSSFSGALLLVSRHRRQSVPLRTSRAQASANGPRSMSTSYWASSGSLA